MQCNEKLQPLLHCSIFHHFPTKPIPHAAKRWHLMTAAELQGGHLNKTAAIYVWLESQRARIGGGSS